MLDMLEEAGLGTDEIDAVGGLTMGADPVAAAMLHAAASRGLDLDAFVVRKAAKDHGMRRRIEGPDVTGRSVVVLEDRHGVRRGFSLGPGFWIEGRPVVLDPPVARRRTPTGPVSAAGRRLTASGSYAVEGEPGAGGRGGLCA